MAQTFTREEVSKHTSPDSLWCIIDSRVYNLTDFLDAHPGGNVLLQQIAGRDATTDFYNLHRQEVLYRYAPKLLIGTIAGETPVVAVDPPAPGSLSTVPYAEPLWLSPAYKSPYYNDSHHRLRAAIREYVDSELFAEAQARERDGEPISAATVARMSEINLIAMRLGPGKHLHGLTLPGGVRGEEFNAFHDLVVAQEMVRARARGFQDGNLAGLMISLTAVNQWANNQELKDRVNRECLSGKRLMSLAVTEAFAGSDVAGIRTTAEKTPEGDYIINGTKVRPLSLSSSISSVIIDNPEMDHERYVCGVFCRCLPDSQGPLGLLGRARRQCRDQEDQNGLLDHCRHFLYPV